MTTRREVLRTIGACASLPLAASLHGCSSEPAVEEYSAAAARTWRHGQVSSLGGARLVTELIRYATLAPSSHNTQCWKFKAGRDSITIVPDYDRRCPAVDPDDHHLFVSLGCAAENLCQAAAAAGFRCAPSFDSAQDTVKIVLEPAPAADSTLFEAVTDRQCTRGEFDGRPLPANDIRQLAAASASTHVDLVLLTDRGALEHVLEHVVAGNTAQMADPAFVAELKSWIRFNEQSAVRFGDGLFAASSGNPTLPTWLGKRMFDLFFTADAENDKYARQVRSSAGVAVFVGQSSTPSDWVEVGRCYQRFALQATALGIRNAMINQPVEVPRLRPQLAGLLGVGARRPDLVVRFGRGPKLPVSLRRPVQAVIA